MSDTQHPIITTPRTRVFLKGPPGSGKTTLAVERLRWLIRQGMPTTAILVLAPQRMLGTPYLEALRDPALGPAGQVDVITLDGLARRIVGLFWPLIGQRAGFAHPSRPPVFLTVETAQYFMDGIVGPLIEGEGYFDAITIERTRLLSQLLDNLNKAALIGIPLAEVTARLKAAWTGEAAQQRVFDQAGECVGRFRDYCLANNLLDFSLQITTFTQHLCPQPAVRAYLFDRYRHLIADNLEEDTPVVHDLLAEWVKHCESAFIVYDEPGGHRMFLGADPASAAQLADACDQQVELTHSYVAPPDILHLAYQVGVSMNRRPVWSVSVGVTATLPAGRRPAGETAGETYPPSPLPVSGRGSDPSSPPLPSPDFRRILHSPGEQEHRFHPQMLDWAAGQIDRLVNEEGVPPREIVVLAPFVSDALRFSLLDRLAARGIPARSHRPSRSLRDEPAARCLLTLVKLAHPGWQLPPPAFDVTLTLMQAIHNMDLVRARLLTDIVYRPKAADRFAWLSAFGAIEGDMRERISPELGECYDTLRQWLIAYREETAEQDAPVDHFLGRLFGEVLSQEGFGFHELSQMREVGGEVRRLRTPDSAGREVGRLRTPDSAPDNGRVAGDLIESARKFRQALEMAPQLPGTEPIGARFVRMVERGMAAATYVHSWRLTHQNAVLVAPAYTYLMTNRPVDYQFWLDVGSAGWWERIYQPLTHPYVLRRDWQPGRPWTDEDEFNARQESLYRLVSGLAHRCRKGIYLGMSDLNEQGYEQRGPLLQAIQSALRRVS